VSGFNITNLRDLGEGDYLVQTAITRPSAPALNYEWRVRDSGNSTKIVDVIVEGVSLLVTHRSDFTSVASQNGIDGLIASLRDKSR
jgi:phospholipid transport system substrate-binding protein